MSDTAAPSRAVEQRGDRGLSPAWLYVAALAAALVVYVATLTPDVCWQDSGEYQWSAGRLSWPPRVDSPWCRPGEAVRVHPWFLVTAHLAGWLPWWNWAYGANLTSAISMALAVANVTLLVRLLTGRTWPAVIGGLAMLVGHTVWTFAVVSEVLGWTAALLSAECLCAWAWSRRGQPGWLLLLFFINGVAISNHMMAAFSLLVFGVWMIAEVVRRRAPVWVLPAAVGAWLVGGTLQWIVLAVEYTRTGDLWATVVSGTVGGFGGQATNLSDVPALLGRSVMYIGLNYPTPLVVAGAVGLVWLWRCRGIGRLVVVLAVLYFLWAARYNVPDQFSFFVPFYVPASVAIGAGTAAVMDRWRRGAKPALVALAVLPVVVYACLPTAARYAGLRFFKRELPYRDPYTYFLQPWKPDDWSARRFAEEALESAPQRAIILPETTAAPPLYYLQDLGPPELRRPDVSVVGPYKARFEPGLAWYRDAEENILPELRAEGRRVFVVSPHPAYVPGWVERWCDLEPFGVLHEVVPAGAGRGAES